MKLKDSLDNNLTIKVQPGEEVLLFKGNFLINGKNGLLDLNSWLESYPTISIPKRKKTFQSIEGSNSQAILDEAAYDNRDIELSIIVSADDEVERTRNISALISAFDSPGYVDFSFYGEPNYVYEVTNAETTSQARITRTSFWMKLTLKLSAKAFKYYRPDEGISINGTLNLYNKLAFNSRPLINMSGSTVVINGDKYTYNTPGGYITIDSDEEQQDVYNTSGVIENAFDINQEFPYLIPGNNVITMTGTLYPRWRTI